MPVAEAHLGIRVDADIAGAIDAARLDENVLGLAPVGAAVHAQRAADRARNAAQEREPRDAGLLRGLRDAQVRRGRAGAHAIAWLDRDLVEAAPEPDHDARHAAVAHDQVGAEADDRDGNVGAADSRAVGEIASSSGMNSACAGPPTRNQVSGAKRLVGEQAAAQRGQRGFEVGERCRGRSFKEP